MKTLIFSLVLTLFAGITNAQEVTELKEARVDGTPLSSEIIRNGDNFTYKVKEAYIREFEKDPLLFVNKYFDFQDLASEVRGEWDIYHVTFKSTKGNLQADFDSNGEMLSSISKFKNVILPRELMHQLYKDNKGWEMVKNVHVTRGKDGVVNQDIYRIKLENGKDRKNVVLEAPAKAVAVASK